LAAVESSPKAALSFELLRIAVSKPYSSQIVFQIRVPLLERSHRKVLLQSVVQSTLKTIHQRGLLVKVVTIEVMLAFQINPHFMVITGRGHLLRFVERLQTKVTVKISLAY
jgi:hypothetical protein